MQPKLAIVFRINLFDNKTKGIKIKIKDINKTHSFVFLLGYNDVAVGILYTVVTDRAQKHTNIK